MTWTLVILLLTATPEERRYAGFTSQDDCLRSRPVSGSIANWGTLNVGDNAQTLVPSLAFCVVDAPPERACTQEAPCSADLNGDGSVNAADYALFMQQFKGNP
jgi:hypothetical protein